MAARVAHFLLGEAPFFPVGLGAAERNRQEKRGNEVERAASAPCLFQANPRVAIDYCQSVNICILGEP